jgi:HrpA-like RNA helicase
METADLTDLILILKGMGAPLDPLDVLASCIDPPDEKRVGAAMTALRALGALDDDGELTGLGGILCYLGISSETGIATLYSLALRCLGHGISIGLLCKIDPFLNPPMMQLPSRKAKHAWSPTTMPSDILAGVAAFDAWSNLERGSPAARAFCEDHFLSDVALGSMVRQRKTILARLERIGASDLDGRRQLAQREFRAALGQAHSTGVTGMQHRTPPSPERFDVHRHSLPMLGAILAVTGRPYFAVRNPRSANGIRFETGAEPVRGLVPLLGVD